MNHGHGWNRSRLTHLNLFNSNHSFFDGAEKPGVIR